MIYTHSTPPMDGVKTVIIRTPYQPRILAFYFGRGRPPALPLFLGVMTDTV